MALEKNNKLTIGILGCGQIAQAAHFESCSKAKNVELIAICDLDESLMNRMAITFNVKKKYKFFNEMLSDPDIEAIIIATADEFHVDLSIQALKAGKHVLCEKPLGCSVEELVELRNVVKMTNKFLQVGHMKRFDIGLQEAKLFIDNEMGEMLAFKAWYCDSTHRYSVTDALQPLIVKGGNTKKPSKDPKEDLKRYFMLAHGSHLIDTARFLAGNIKYVQARYLNKFGAHSWFIETEFKNGSIGHLDLTIAVRMDWHEGFQIYGEHGSVLGKTFNPWLYKTSEVDIFKEKDVSTIRPLGPDGHFYRRQVEAFSKKCKSNEKIEVADVNDGLECVKTMVAIRQSIELRKRVYINDVSGSV